MVVGSFSTSWFLEKLTAEKLIETMSRSDGRTCDFQRNIDQIDVGPVYSAKLYLVD